MIRATIEVDGQVLILGPGTERPDLPIALRHVADLPTPIWGDDVTPSNIVAPEPMRVLLRGEDIGRVMNVHVSGEHVFSDSRTPIDFIVHSTTIDLVMELDRASVPVPYGR